MCNDFSRASNVLPFYNFHVDIHLDDGKIKIKTKPKCIMIRNRQKKKKQGSS